MADENQGFLSNGGNTFGNWLQSWFGGGSAPPSTQTPALDPQKTLEAAIRAMPDKNGVVGTNALLGLGMGMMSSNDPNEAWGQAYKGFLSGVTADSQQAVARLKAQQQQLETRAIQQYLMNRPDLDKASQWGIISKPEVAGSLTLEENKPQVTKPGDYITRRGQTTQNPFEPKIETGIDSSGREVRRTVQLPGNLPPGAYDIPTRTMGPGGTLSAPQPFTSKLSPGEIEQQQKLAGGRAETQVKDEAKAGAGKVVLDLLGKIKGQIKSDQDPSVQTRFESAAGPYMSAAADASPTNPARIYYEKFGASATDKQTLANIKQYAQAIDSQLQSAMLRGEGAIQVQERLMVGKILGEVPASRSAAEALSKVQAAEDIITAMFKTQGGPSVPGAPAPLIEYPNGVKILRQVR